MLCSCDFCMHWALPKVKVVVTIFAQYMTIAMHKSFCDLIVHAFNQLRYSKLDGIKINKISQEVSSFKCKFLAHLWCAYAIPLCLS